MIKVEGCIGPDGAFWPCSHCNPEMCKCRSTKRFVRAYAVISSEADLHHITSHPRSTHPTTIPMVERS